MPEDRLLVLEKKIDAMYVSVEKVRRYLFWTAVVTIALVVLPAIGLVFTIPKFISTYSAALNGGDINSLDLEGLY